MTKMPGNIELIDISMLKPYERNSRTHSESQLQKIADSIKEFGFTNPVLIDNDNSIIAGHGRVIAAGLLKMDRVPCIRIGYMTKAQKKAYIIADNKLAEQAGWDEELLRIELGELNSLDYDIGVIGLSEGEIKKLLEPPEKKEPSSNVKKKKNDSVFICPHCGKEIDGKITLTAGE
ncbi:ParB-like nuclease family protein [Anaerobacterium chartisolvens]|uniref:ParB-like nuclease family protein n=1 Tax=Anaerobacterium chartisolvens TaxID=1297424 RepID=A0A369BH63_9FIRM|nr:ParB/Srx family N-terminal domain-containing protein [Anaerobacterium chartisolvens]RCX20893.1 ParB-like nuclease family protein [Anaerobacterium chartisolvens]